MVIKKLLAEEFIEVYNLNQLPIVLYGAGKIGRKTLGWFRKRNIEPYFFGDSSRDLVGDRIDDMIVMSIEQLRKLDFNGYIIITVGIDKLDEIIKILEVNNWGENVYYITIKEKYEINTMEQLYSWLKTNPWHLQSVYSNIENFSKEYIERLVENRPKVYLEGKQLKILSHSESGVNFENNLRRTFYTPNTYSNKLYFFGDSRVVGYLSEDQYTIESFLQKKVIDELSTPYLVINKGIFLDYTNIYLEMIKGEEYTEGDIVMLGLSPRLYEKGSKRLNTSIEKRTEVFTFYLKQINDYLKNKKVKFYFCIMPIVSDVKNPSAIEYYLQKEVFPNHKNVLNIDDQYFMELCNVGQVTVIDLRKAIQRPHPYGDFFIDHSHYGAKGNELLAETILKVLKTNSTMENLSDEVAGLKDQYEEICYEEKLQIEDVNFKEYLGNIRRFGSDEIQSNGSIVMNCNPFTKGHRYLIEEASKQVDTLYIFIVEEDRSTFPFKVRKELVENGVSDLKNVVVLSSGKYIISTKTFPEYFSKDFLQESMIDASKDLFLFAGKIAPILQIKKRFVGTEPNCKVTHQYNVQMKEILPKYGIEVIEIERKKEEGIVISASIVRRLMEQGKLEELEKIVPTCTYKYLLKHK